MVYRDGHQPRAHDAKVSDQEFRAVCRQNGNRLAALVSPLGKAASACVGQEVDLAMRVFARTGPVEAVDERN